mgnify:FL=1
MAIKYRINRDLLPSEWGLTRDIIIEQEGTAGLGAGQAVAGDLKNKAKSQKALKDDIELQTRQTRQRRLTFNQWAEQNERTINHIKTFGGNVLDSSTRLTDFGNQAIQLTDEMGWAGRQLGEAFQQLTSELTKQIDTFHNLSEVGIQFTGGLMEYRRMAIEAGVSLDTFQSVVTSISGIIAIFGGNALIGARRFSRISGAIQDEFGPAMNRLGISFEDQIEYLSNYLEIQTRQGRAQFMTDRQLQLGTQGYIKQLDLLATITGKQRKQIADAIRVATADKSIAGIFQALEAGANENLRGIIGALEGMQDSEMKQGMKDLIATGGIPMTEMGKSLMLLNPQLGTMAKRARDGEIGVDQFAAAIRQTAELANARSDAELRLTPILQQQGNQVLTAITQMRSMTEFGKGLTEAQKTQQRSMESSDKAMAGLRQSFQRLANALITALAPAIEFISKGFNLVAVMLEKITRGGDNSLLGFGLAIGGAILAIKALGVAATMLKGTFGMLGRIGGIGGKGGGAAMGLTGAMRAAGTPGGAAGVIGGGAAIGAGVGLMGLLGGAGIGAGLFLTGKGLGVVAEGLERITKIKKDDLSQIVSDIGSLTTTFVDLNANSAKFSSNMATFASTINEAVKELDTQPIVEYTKNLKELGNETLKVNSKLASTTAGAGKVTGDKLDTLNSTMNEILMVLTDNTKYARIISKKDFEGNLMKTV